MRNSAINHITLARSNELVIELFVINHDQLTISLQIYMEIR